MNNSSEKFISFVMTIVIVIVFLLMCSILGGCSKESEEEQVFDPKISKVKLVLTNTPNYSAENTNLLNLTIESIELVEGSNGDTQIKVCKVVDTHLSRNRKGLNDWEDICLDMNMPYGRYRFRLWDDERTMYAQADVIVVDEIREYFVLDLWVR